MEKKSLLLFKNQFESREQAEAVLDYSFPHISKSGFRASVLISMFELLMIIRVLTIGLGSQERNRQYMVCYIFLFTVNFVIAVCIPVWSKDYKRYSAHIYIMQYVYTIAITLWAIRITILDAMYHDYFDVIVYMTITLIAPIICFVNPIFLVLVQGVGDIIILTQILILGYSGFAINFSVYSIISITVCIAFHRAKKEMYISQVRLHEKAVRDPLTGLLNRQTLREHGERIWAEALKNNSPVSVIMADIDFFKSINDKYGHLEGDRCIKKFADIFEKACDCDEYKCYRYGGEEFVMLLPKADRTEAVAKAEAVMKEIHRAFSGAEDAINATASMGVYSGTPTEDDYLELFLSRADKLLYKAKENGRNCYMV